MADASFLKSQSPDQEPVRNASFTELALGEKRPGQEYGSMDSYKWIQTVGKGAFGIVFKMLDRRTNKVVAVKSVRGPGAQAQHNASTLSEANFLAACQGHGSIVQFIDVAADSTGNLYLVMEFVGPSLREHQQKRGSPFPEDKTRDMMRQLLQAAQKMHGAGVIHRDIKPENVLVSQSGALLKVCDLGLATMLRPAGTPYDVRRVGTMIYSSPEQLAGSRSYGTAVDMWALGCVMAELLTGHRLFHANTMEGLIAKVHSLRDLLRGRGLQAFDVLRLPGFSSAGREVLAGLLAFAPEDRLTAEAALQHPWFMEGLDLTLSL